MKGKGTVLMALGALLVLAAAALTGYNLLESGKAKQASAQVVQVLEEELKVETMPRQEAASGETTPETQPDYIRFPNMEMPVTTVDGQDYIGKIQIPVLDLELPVLADWSYEGLKTAPCRYRGSAYSGGLILMAHNFDSHFGRIGDLHPGDYVFFTDMDGNKFTYLVADQEELPGTAIEDMEAGDWPLTLFTCTYGGQNRVTIRCEACA